MALNKLHKKDFTIAIKHGSDSGAVKFKKEATKGELFFDTAQNKLYIASTDAGASDASLKEVQFSNTVVPFQNNYSMNFDGTDDRLNVASPVTTSAQQGTVSAWIKAASASATRVVFFQSDTTDTSNNTAFDLSISPIGVASIGWINGSANSDILYKRGSTTVDDGNWHHIAWTCDGNTWKIYVDGADEGTLALTTGTASDGNWFGDLSSINTCRIGCQERNFGTSSFFNGNIDEVAVWDSALTASQISNIYKGESNGGSGGTNGTPGDLLSFSPNHWWRMGDGTEANSGTTIYDMSSNNVNATVVNATSGTNTSGADYQADTP